MITLISLATPSVLLRGHKSSSVQCAPFSINCFIALAREYHHLIHCTLTCRLEEIIVSIALLIPKSKMYRVSDCFIVAASFR